ncbi:MAG TPA: Do family serine endopeptidase [Lutibacter sp.]|nr:Do family serine endopeptidase [Lutibacter sp.]
MKKIATYTFVALIASAFTLIGSKYYLNNSEKELEIIQESAPQIVQTNYNKMTPYAAETTDFIHAAETTVDAVVHVKNTAVKTVHNPLDEYFYGRSNGRKYKQVGTGSGVIISPDGYIITNNHVVANATEIEITLNNKKVYKATLIGSDENNDIALVKIEATDLPHITFADSDSIKIGEWVLAVGNPYNLTSTVTAGIVSAKGRDLDGNNTIESYIQTDAAVNPGNSGGALVNTRGELVGINTAISSKTGSYIGYSFAVPSNIAKKVVEDLIEYGNVQRAFLGIQFVELNGQNAKKLDTPISEGIFVTKVLNGGAAIEAGIEENDIIIKINSTKITKFSDLKGQLNAARPGENMNITVLRDNEEKVFPVILKNKFGKEVFSETDFIDNVLGLQLQEISEKQKQKYQIDYGVSISKIDNVSFSRYGIKENAIILAIERQKIQSVTDVEQLMRHYENNEYVTLQILNTNGKLEYVSLKL